MKHQYKNRLMHGFIILMTLLLCKLGFWQIQRGHHFEANLAQAASQSKLPALKLHPEQHHWPANRQLVVDGAYQNNLSLLQDNQLYRHYVGYHVLTPLKLKPNQPWLLIDRGWIPHHQRDNHLPHILSVNKPQHLQGIIYYSQKGFTLGHDDHSILITQIDLSKLSQRWHHTLYPFVLALNPGHPGAYLNTHRAQTKHDPYRNFSYAGQFFALALLLAITYIIVQNKEQK
jgi:cytochrome oxidase assembly protein ShyY1